MLSSDGPFFDEFNPYSEKKLNSGRKSMKVDLKMIKNDGLTIS